MLEMKLEAFRQSAHRGEVDIKSLSIQRILGRLMDCGRSNSFQHKSLKIHRDVLNFASHVFKLSVVYV